MQFTAPQLEFALEALKRSLEESNLGPVQKIFARLQLARPLARRNAVQAAAEQLHQDGLMPMDGQQQLLSPEAWRRIIEILIELWPIIVRLF